jgi:hypothetical protein
MIESKLKKKHQSRSQRNQFENLIFKLNANQHQLQKRTNNRSD